MHLTEKLLNNYSRNLPPTLSKFDYVIVKVEPFIDLILRFNEAEGILSIFGFFSLLWLDAYITWNKTQNNDIEFLLIPIEDVWVPKLMIGNSVQKRTIYTFDNDFDKRTDLVRYTHDGGARVLAGGVIDTACEANMYYFPFDTQNCDIELYEECFGIYISITNKSNQKILQTALQMHKPSSEWEIKNVSPVRVPSKMNHVKIQIQFERKPLFLCISLVVPVFLISFVNVFVFILPIDSGERTSLAVTLFLTFVVVITMVAEILPPSSQVSVFQLLLFTKVITSVLTTIMAIITISIYNKNENDISWLMILYKSFGKWKCKQVQQEPNGQGSSPVSVRPEQTTTNFRGRQQQIPIDVPGCQQQMPTVVPVCSGQMPTVVPGCSGQMSTVVPGCSGQMPSHIQGYQQQIATDILGRLDRDWKLLAHKIDCCCIIVLILELLFEMVALTVIFVRKGS
ncbi:unnamed protein product [Mytilus coruscus]|uniref:CHRNN n=1 Tax=Mytilus coruscus TaxID=42192 RepID=A0A6J8BJP1_MYTCO|nr:unnamed protein product [Mytilus coruscus]